MLDHLRVERRADCPGARRGLHVGGHANETVPRFDEQGGRAAHDLRDRIDILETVGDALLAETQVRHGFLADRHGVRSEVRLAHPLRVIAQEMERGLDEVRVKAVRGFQVADEMLHLQLPALARPVGDLFVEPPVGDPAR